MKRYRMQARDQLATLFLGDAVKALRRLPAQSVHCCITSPPYYDLRDYGVDGQIGLEETPDAYVARLVEVFREVRRVLRDDSVLWLNLGDSYASGEIGRHDTLVKEGICKGVAGVVGKRGIGTHREHLRMKTGLTSKQLLGIPWRVAFALQADGWFLRSACPWVKRNPLPESVTDRPGTAHEYVFLLAKSARYFYDVEAVKESVAPASIKRAAYGLNSRNSGFAKDARTGSSFEKTRTDMTMGEAGFVNPAGRNRRTSDWWFDSLRAILEGKSSAVTDEDGDMLAFPVNPRPYKGSHFAVMPETLVEPCILAGCPVDGTVLDPFLGSGTVAAVALRLGRSAIGIDLNEEYLGLAKQRVGEAVRKVKFRRATLL